MRSEATMLRQQLLLCDSLRSSLCRLMNNSSFATRRAGKFSVVSDVMSTPFLGLASLVAGSDDPHRWAGYVRRIV